MGRATRRAFVALIAAVCPPAPAPASADISMRVEEGARRFIACMHPIVARLLSLCILVLDFLPLLSFRAPRRFSRLSSTEAAHFIRSLSHSRLAPVRILLAAMRGLVLSLYFDQSEVHAAIGYQPVAFMRERLSLRSALLASEGESGP